MMMMIGYRTEIGQLTVSNYGGTPLHFISQRALPLISSTTNHQMSCLMRCAVLCCGRRRGLGGANYSTLLGGLPFPRLLNGYPGLRQVPCRQRERASRTLIMATAEAARGIAKQSKVVALNNYSSTAQQLYVYRYYYKATYSSAHARCIYSTNLDR